MAKMKREDKLSSSSNSIAGVESYAITNYMSQSEEKWPRALHAENMTFSMFFALLMWDIIFARVPDVFRAPFQVSASKGVVHGASHKNKSRW